MGYRDSGEEVLEGLAVFEPAEHLFHGFGTDDYVTLEGIIECGDREEDEGDDERPP
jgi:hypothetical protein